VETAPRRIHLWDKADLIAANFIPVVLNGDAGARPGLVANFFRRVARHFANEMAVVTPNGQLLAHSPAEGLKKWQALPAEERRRLDDLGLYDSSRDLASPKGGVILNVFARALTRDAAGRLQLYKTEVARSREAGRDHLWLTEAEWRSLVPARARRGETFPVPPPLTDRICRRYLIDLVRVGGNGGPRRPDQVLAEHLRLTVEEVTPTRVCLRLDGSARLATHDPNGGARGKQPKVDDFRLQGFLTYDPGLRKLTRFDLIAFSETGHYDEIHRRVVPLGVAFDLASGDTPTERVPPSSFGKDYFGKAR
jgi:hypothetical protein